MIGMSRSTVSRSIKAAEESSAARDKLERYEVPSIPAVQMNASKLTAADLDKYSDEQLRQIAERIKSQQAASKPVRKVSPAAVNDAEAVIIARVLKELKDAYSIPLHETTRLSQQECADFRKVYEMIGTRLFFSPTAAELMGLLKILVEITVQASQKQGE
jgi:uncharacterized protein YfkK (UPF0435 family)